MKGFRMYIGSFYPPEYVDILVSEEEFNILTEKAINYGDLYTSDKNTAWGITNVVRYSTDYTPDEVVLIFKRILKGILNNWYAGKIYNSINYALLCRYKVRNQITEYDNIRYACGCLHEGNTHDNDFLMTKDEYNAINWEIVSSLQYVICEEEIIIDGYMDEIQYQDTLCPDCEDTRFTKEHTDNSMNGMLLMHGIRAYHHSGNNSMDKLIEDLYHVQEISHTAEICCSLYGQPVGWIGFTLRGNVLAAYRNDAYTRINDLGERVSSLGDIAIHNKHEMYTNSNYNELVVTHYKTKDIWIKKNALERRLVTEAEMDAIAAYFDCDWFIVNK